MKLKLYLKDKGEKPADFAKRVGVAHTTIWRAMNGKTTPTPDTFRAIKKATRSKVTANDFI